MNLIKKFLRDEEGATAIEYGLMAALISVIVVANVKDIGSKINAAFFTISTALTAG
jgi:pilus assembly protein Flp/PilA